MREIIEHLVANLVKYSIFNGTNPIKKEIRSNIFTLVIFHIFFYNMKKAIVKMQIFIELYILNIK